MHGDAGWRIWLAVYLVSLVGFKNRTAVLFNWAIAFAGPGRPQPAITTGAAAHQLGRRTLSTVRAEL